MIHKRFYTSLAVSVLMLLVYGSASAYAAPYSSYTYDWWKNAVPSASAYVPSIVVDGADMGVGPLKNPGDLYVRGDRIYVADSGNNRVVCTDRNFRPYMVISSFHVPDGIDGFDEPKGVFVTEAGHIYVADKGNERIVEFDSEGEIVRIIGKPRSDVEGVLSEDMIYRPLRVGVDRAGRVYVIADGIFDGIMEFGVDGGFKGFMGAPKVAPNPWEYFWSKISTKEQKRRRALFLPIEYSSLDIDGRGFIYASVSGGATQKEEAVRRLNPTGVDVLRRTGSFPPVGDVDFPHEESEASITGRSVLIDVAARENGMYSVLDRQRCRIFTYDENGELLYIFGARGDVRGAFRNPVAIDWMGEAFLVLDEANGCLTKLEPTEYASFMHQAIDLHNQGKYDEAADMWRNVLRYNANCEAAYIGIGRSLMRQGLYSEAMDNFKLGNSREGYSKAFKLHKKEVANRTFGYVMTAVVVVILALAVLRKVRLFSRSASDGDASELEPMTKYHARMIYRAEEGPITGKRIWDSLKYAFWVICHPFDGFWDLKHERRGNTVSATIILVLIALTHVFARQYTGFVLNKNDPKRLNVLLEISTVLVPFALWIVVNWSLTTLTDGKGTLKDIYIATAYALFPIFLINVPLTIWSRYMTMEQGAFFTFFRVLSLIWAGWLVFSGNMVTHDFEGGKTFGMSLLTVAGMGVVIFISLLYASLIDQFIGFVKDIRTEIVFRM